VWPSYAVLALRMYVLQLGSHWGLSLGADKRALV
jgi:hypothetical protein